MLKLDYEAMETEAGKLQTEGNNFQTCIDTMSSIISGLPAIWEADTCERYLDQFDEAKPTLNSVREMIEDMATQMRSISENFAQADSDMTGQMQ